MDTIEKYGLNPNFLILGFVTELMGKQVKVHGTPVWNEELEQGIQIIGLEFTFDENARMELTKQNVKSSNKIWMSLQYHNL